METAEAHNQRLTGIARFKERLDDETKKSISDEEFQFLLESIEKVGRADAIKSAKSEELIAELQLRGYTVK